MEEPESLTTNELDDLDEQAGFDLRALDLALLRSPVVVRALGGIAVASLVLIWPERTDRILARLIGVAILVLAATSVWAALRRPPRQLVDAGVGLLGLSTAVVLLLSPNRSEATLARLVGLILIAIAGRDLLRLLLSNTEQSPRWVVSRSLAVFGSGGLLVLFPAEVFSTATTIAAAGWIVLSMVVIVASLDPATTGVSSYRASGRLIGDWLADQPKSVEDRQALYDKILYEGATTSRRVVRFLALMTFASVIASMGVITDSTAVVIGAMLIAPLMTPLMGMAISLVMGWPRRLTRSALVAASGISLAIGIGVLLGFGAPAIIDTTTNSQIIARSSPTVLDLIIAVAAGSAGAYGLSRPDVSDSLPGVAIAISLVPPLTVVGIAYSQGDWRSGHGALLLFTTNMLAILVMGGITFVVTGVTPLRRVADNQHRVRTSLAAVAALAAVVTGALLLNGDQVTADLLERSSTEDAVSDWLEDYPRHTLVRVDLDGEQVIATVVGPSQEAPSAQSMADALATALDRDITADLRLIVEERDTASSTG